MGKKLLNEEQELYVISNYKTMTYKEIAENLGEPFTELKIRSWLSNHGYTKKQYKTHDRNIFLAKM